MTLMIVEPKPYHQYSARVARPEKTAYFFTGRMAHWIGFNCSTEMPPSFTPDSGAASGEDLLDVGAVRIVAIAVGSLGAFRAIENEKRDHVNEHDQTKHHGSDEDRWIWRRRRCGSPRRRRSHD